MMQKYLITGVGGFVGNHLWNLLESSGEQPDILGVDLHTGNGSRKIIPVDLTDRPKVVELIADFKPEFVIHLAASSSVGQSWKEPAHCFLNNMTAFLNILDAVRDHVPYCRILSVGSAEVYGSGKDSDSPFREEDPLFPENPYAVGRLAQEQMSRVYVDGFGMNIISTRSFNHIGPDQNPRFAVASFVKQLTDAKKRGDRQAVLKTGNVDLIRDLSDVRDVVRAYYLLLHRGCSGDVYNICSGKGVSLRSVIEEVAAFLGLGVEIVVDPLLLRPTDPPVVVGSPQKIYRETTWRAEISLSQTFHDMVDTNLLPGMASFCFE